MPRGQYTNAERKVRITKFYEKHRRMPSFRELCTLAGYTSTNAAMRLVRKLEEERFLERDHTGRLIPKHLLGAVRILGLVEAGFPSPAEEELSDTMTMDEYLIKNREATYMLRVKGDSMKDAGILEGDMVVVERTDKAREGDIVIAEVDGAWTMKYLRNKQGRFFLEAANKKYAPIRPREGLSVGAVVRAVVRKY